MIYLIALAAALAPAIPLLQVSGSQLAKAKSYWLLGLLTVGICWLAQTELWLAFIGLAFLCKWRTPESHATLIQWAAIGLSWFLLLQVPRDLYDYIAAGWIVVALGQVVLVVLRYRAVGVRVGGTFGSHALTGIYLAAVFPFFPFWLWPALAVGVFITSSILGALAISVASVWLWPWTWPCFTAVAVGVAILWCWSPEIRGRRVFEWVLRGDTTDSFYARWYAWRVAIHELAHSKRHWALGFGPNTVTKSLRVWGSRLGVELPHEVTNEALHHTFEYGLVGVLSIVAFLCRIAPHLQIGETWSAAWVGLVVMSFGHWPIRHPTIGLAFLVISARLAIG